MKNTDKNNNIFLQTALDVLPQGIYAEDQDSLKSIINYSIDQGRYPKEN